ncbi:type III pantothenate kinase [Rubritalea tangerina]|uniref:Type III pantothenate kinase n=2 Tax=Rubritalea tangerina TaxID=430798 RepID=A0ABW4ZES6_9BACT
MRYLLIDNSNTRTKLSFGSRDSIESWHEVIPTVELSEQRLNQALNGQLYDAVMLCSVVPQKAELMERYFSQSPFHNLCHTSKLGIAINYPHPQQIGADRLANAVGVNALYQTPAIVIDFGTAVTFDAVGADATYLGGVIAPGLASMTQNLAKRTALLPQIELSEPKHAIGKSTTEAMLAGAVYGYRGLIKEIISKLSDEMQCTPTVVATGGDAALIAKGLPEINHVSPTLTLEGIRIAATLQF